MKIFIACLIIVLVSLAVSVFLIRVRLSVFLSLSGSRIYLRLGFLKMTLYPVDKNKPSERTEHSDGKTGKGVKKTLKFLKENSSHIKKSLLRLKRRVRIEKFNFYYKCGFNDAALTALLYGGVNGAFYNIYAFLDRNFKVKEMRGDIFADFNENKKQISLDSMFCLTVSDIIYAVWALLPVIKNIKNKNKGGALNVRTSYSGNDGNSNAKY